MPIGKMWIYRLLFVCLFVLIVFCSFVSVIAWLRISPASNCARPFIGVQGRESQIFENFAPQKAQNRPANRPARALNYIIELGGVLPCLACRPTLTEVKVTFYL